MDLKCRNHHDRFCYICRHVVLPDRRARITDFVKKSYHAYFRVKLGDQDKPFAPHICCKTCVQNLRDWRNKTRKSMPSGVPMVWWEGKDHITDCYFCMTKLQGINHKNKHHVQYPDVPSAIKPVPHGPGVPVPEPDVNMDLSSDPESSDAANADESGAYEPAEGDRPVPLSQAELNDLTRDLNLSKESAQLLGSRLRERRLLAPGTTFYWYRDREKDFREFFTFGNGDFSSTRQVEVSRQLITATSSHQSLLHTQLKWKKPTTAWNVCCPPSTTRTKTGLSVEISR